MHPHHLGKCESDAPLFGCRVAHQQLTLINLGGE